jgi:chromosome segregation ATPase
MKKNARMSGLGFFMLLLTVSGVAMGQVDKKAAEVKKLEAGLTLAKNNVAKNEKQIAIADSLISTGTNQVNESKAETKTIAAERKKLDKDYAAGKKLLDKQAGSKDKTEAAKAKTDIKALDTKYKADVKASDNRLKESTKKSTTGSSNLSKGKASKKTAEDGLKSSQTSLDAAQAKYDAATGAAVEKSETKKKKK